MARKRIRFTRHKERAVVRSASYGIHQSEWRPLAESVLPTPPKTWPSLQYPHPSFVYTSRWTWRSETGGHMIPEEREQFRQWMRERGGFGRSPAESRGNE
jgi:hypothetical protein